MDNGWTCLVLPDGTAIAVKWELGFAIFICPRRRVWVQVLPDLSLIHREGESEPNLLEKKQLSSVETK